MVNDLESLMRRIDELPLARAKREAAKAELAAAFALVELVAAIIARSESLVASLARAAPLAGGGVPDAGDLAEERPPAAE